MNDENKNETLQNGGATGAPVSEIQAPEETPLTAAQEKASEKANAKAKADEKKAQEKASEKAAGKTEKSSVKTYICKRACFFEQLYKEGEEITTDASLDSSIWEIKA